MPNNKQITIVVLLNIILFVTVMLFIVTPNIVTAQASNPTYEALAPLSESQKNINLQDPKGYFTNMFSVFVSIIGILAVIRLMFCGFQYMTSEAISSKEEAKKCIWIILGGIFLLLLSYLILTTINKDLVTLSFFDKVTNRVRPAANTNITIQRTSDPNATNINTSPLAQSFRTQITSILNSGTSGFLSPSNPKVTVIANGGFTITANSGTTDQRKAVQAAAQSVCSNISGSFTGGSNAGSFSMECAK